MGLPGRNRTADTRPNRWKVQLAEPEPSTVEHQGRLARLQACIITDPIRPGERALTVQMPPGSPGYRS